MRTMGLLPTGEGGGMGLLPTAGSGGTGLPLGLLNSSAGWADPSFPAERC